MNEDQRKRFEAELARERQMRQKAEWSATAGFVVWLSGLYVRHVPRATPRQVRAWGTLLSRTLFGSGS